ncbi:hypothetical protein MUK42_36924 [Musa troglodytarum]|uniref:Uncharacterized protein n=1 Tax=Musa troglodytarum TaxID=320322 RepID=A0A9E7GAN0_9LILI|nr:hypothetical protein MUK42_36924 [Musa troglodytarum]
MERWLSCCATERVRELEPFGKDEFVVVSVGSLGRRREPPVSQLLHSPLDIVLIYEPSTLIHHCYCVELELVEGLWFGLRGRVSLDLDTI